MKKIILHTTLLCFISCNQGVWISENIYRPKKPEFKILREPFMPNDLVNTKCIYMSKKTFENYDGNRLIGYMGFYSDGKMIIGNTFENKIFTIVNTRSSFNTASVIGYYRVDGDKIKMEYFVPGDGGHYQTKEGIIKKDTLILFETFNVFLKKDTRRDTLVKSNFLLK